MTFDTDDKGRPQNIFIKNSTNKCFDKAVSQNIAQWRYACKTPMHGLEARITFELLYSGPPAGLSDGPIAPPVGGSPIVDAAAVHCRHFDLARSTFEEAAANPGLTAACAHEPSYPSDCGLQRTTSAEVWLSFDVAPTGEVANAKVVRGNSTCLADHSLSWLRRIQFAPSESGYKTRGAIYHYEESAPQPQLHDLPAPGGTDGG